VAPFGEGNDAAKKTFDRRSGRPVPPSILKTYREAMADYAWHPEQKFENGDRSDTGVTRRRHINAIAIEYIGKEANRWEEQFYLGELPEAAIEYGASNQGNNQIVDTLALVSKQAGQSTLAARAGITRQELAAILQGTSKPRRSTLKALMTAAMQLTEEGR
jgi:DNA-binding phage protein